MSDNEAALNTKVGGGVLQWGRDDSEISRRIAESTSPMKVLLKTKNETWLLREWIKHHSSLVGAENLIIADNYSTNSETLDILGEASAHSTTFQFKGFHNHLHNRECYRSLYESLCISCDFFATIDTDERIVWLDNGHWRFDAISGQLLDGLSKSLVYPMPLIGNFATSRDKFFFPFEAEDALQMIVWGKPLIGATAAVPDGHCLHSVQYPFNLLAVDEPLNFLILHLHRLHPEQRIQANREKLISRGLISRDVEIADIEKSVNKAALERDPTAERCFSELVALIKQAPDVSGLVWGPSDFRQSIVLRPDSLIDFGSQSTREAFSELCVHGVQKAFRGPATV